MMAGLSLINSGMGHPGHSWSRETMEAEAALIRQETVPTDFDGLACHLGYGKRVGTLRRAIDDATTRAGIVARLPTVIPSYGDNFERLADAYLRELAQEVAPLMAAE